MILVPQYQKATIGAAVNGPPAPYFAARMQRFSASRAYNNAPNIHYARLSNSSGANITYTRQSAQSGSSGAGPSALVFGFFGGGSVVVPANGFVDVPLEFTWVTTNNTSFTAVTTLFREMRGNIAGVPKNFNVWLNHTCSVEVNGLGADVICTPASYTFLGPFDVA